MKKAFLIFSLWLVSYTYAYAATYTLPADITSNPFRCTGSGPVYTCNGTINLPEDTIIILTADVTLNITGNFRAEEDFSVQANGYSLNINASNDVSISSNADFTGNITAGDDIAIGEDSTIVGNLTAADNLTLDQDTVVNGVCSPAHTQCTGGGTPPAGACDTFADYFDLSRYDNQDGTVNWSSDWFETNDNGSPTGGDIRIVGNRLRLQNNNRAITRSADLSPYASATISFDYQESGFDNNNDYVDIEIRGGGVGWTSLQHFAGSNVNTGTASLVVASSFLASDFQVRFLTSGSLGSNDRFYIDNLQIDACGNSVLPSPAIDFHFDEAIWSGAANEVFDSAANANHASISSGSGLDTIADGAVCRAGRFDGINDYIVSGDIFSVLRTTASMSFWIKTTQTGNDTNWLAPGVAGIEQNGGGDDIFWGWLDASGHIGISKWDTPSAKSNLAINDGNYHHVVLTRDSPSGAYKIYIDGTLDQTGTTGTGDVGTSFSSIGRIEDTAGSPEYLQADLDEVMVFNQVLSDAQVSVIYTNQLAGNNYDGSARVCAVTGVDHYVISHSNIAVTCEAQLVTVSAHDLSHTDMAPVAGTTITLSTSIPNDGWALNSGGGTFTAPDQYSFDGIETSAQFWLRKTTATTAPHMDVDVSDGTAGDVDGSSEDPGTIEFRDSAFRIYADGVNNAIGTQIAGKSSNVAPGDQVLTLKAVQTNTDTGACDTVLTGVTSVQLGYECVNPVSCSSRPLYLGSTSAAASIAGTNSGDAVSYQNIALDFGVTGEASFVLNYPDTGAIRLYAQHTLPATLPSTGVTLNGSSNQFVSRPFGFDIQAVDNPAASDHTGSVYRAAGEAFTVNVSAALWNTADDGNADGVPDNHDDNDPSNNADLSGNSVTLGGMSYVGAPNFGLEGEQVQIDAIFIDPIISSYPDANFPAQILNGFTLGADSTNSAVFNNVGVIEMRASISDGDYLATGAVGTQAMVSKSGYVGRFNPHHYSVTAAMVNNGCGTFTYAGQPFDANVTLQARNLGDILTNGYRGGYATLDIATELNVQNSATSAAYDNEAYTVNEGFSSGTIGQAQFDIDLRWDMPQQAETNSSVQLISTSDEVTLVASSPVSLGNTDVRYGRLWMSNVYGSELTNLTMPMRTQYFNGSNYIVNIDDSCTTIDHSVLNELGVTQSLTNGGSSLVTVNNITAVAGVLDINLTAPGVGHTGFVEVVPDLTISGESWLKYDWDSTVTSPGLENPSARANFGIYQGDSRQIYYRQIYR